MRLNPREPRVRQPEAIPVHDDFVSEAVNHSAPAKPTIWGQTLNHHIYRINV
jgi:hypothetical protein